MHVLILGGTTEAHALARALAGAGIQGLYSYAGRTARPVAQPLPTRTGGFGGAEGLVQALRRDAITHVIDATHPFAATISANAVAACRRTGTPLLALERPEWRPGPGDRWQAVPDIEAAARALPQDPTRVFLAIGRQHLGAFAARPVHDYLLRLVDPPEGPLPLPRARVVVDRGPFTLDGDLALMRQAGIRIVVAKNAGGSGARAKIDAARLLGLPVVMVARPRLADRATVASVEQALDWLHHTPLGV